MAEPGLPGFSYFMIRVQRSEPERPATVSGVIERLGTGETRPFANGTQLIVLLGRWSDGSKMEAPPPVSNEDAPTGGTP